MKITDVRTHALQAPGRTLFVVTVHTDAGLVGVGEGGLQRRWRAMEGAVAHLKPWLIGQESHRIQYLWQRMWRGGFYPADRTIGSAISAIDIALWDLKGKALGAPVYELIGGRCRDYVEVFTSPGYLMNRTLADSIELSHRTQVGDVDAAAELAQLLQAKGFPYFRLGLPSTGNTFDARQSMRRSVEQFRAVRNSVGDGLKLMVDVHARLTPDEATEYCRELTSLNMFVVEDPIRSDHPFEYGRLRRHVSLPLAAGEQWCGKTEFRLAIESGWLDYVRLDVCIAGGISEAIKVSSLAETHAARMLFHNPLGPICTAASLHLDIALDNAGPQEVIFAPDFLPDVFQCSFELVEGRQLTIPRAPGLGVEFDAIAATRYPAEMTEPPHDHRPDGSFTNH